MAFQSVNEYNDDRYAGMFRLVNHGNTADVIFLYKSSSVIMKVNCHYIKTDTFSGYVQCLGASNGCPACAMKNA